MAAPKTYDPKAVVVNYGGVDLSGFADGSFIDIERSTDAYEKTTGADGRTDRVKLNDSSGMITITLQQTSDSNDYLSSVALLDENTSDAVLPFMIKDFSGKSLYLSPSAWVKKIPNGGFDKQIGTREWQFDCTDLQMFHGGNN